VSVAVPAAEAVKTGFAIDELLKVPIPAGLTTQA
jgi:hypothetical protein